MRTVFGWVASLTLFLGVSAGWADTVTLNNGDKITGKIEEVNPDAVIVTTPYAGKLTIQRTAVKTMQSDAVVKIVRPQGEPEQMYLSPQPEGKGWRETAAFVPPPPPGPPRHTSFLLLGPDWKNQLAFGIVNTTGNDETTSLAASLVFNYKKAPDELTIKFVGNYGVSNGTQNAGLFDENAVWRHDWTPRIYGYWDDDARYDAIMGISLQATSTVGLGYYLVKSDKLNIDVRGGPGITYQKLFDGSDNFSAAVAAGLRASYIINDHLSATEDAYYSAALNNFQDIWSITSTTALLMKLDIESGLGLKLAFDEMYNNSPSAGKQNNDTRLTLSLTLDF